jgi:hypothetical protein
MNEKSLEAVAIKLNEVRQNPKYKRNFPKSLWEDIFELIRELSLSKVCDRLKLDQGYVLKKLGSQSSLIGPKELKFQEVFVPSQHQETVTIELFHSDLRAKIQGPPSCIGALKNLFRER